MLLNEFGDLFRLESRLQVKLVFLLGEKDFHAAVVWIDHQAARRLVNLANFSHDLGRVLANAGDVLLGFFLAQLFELVSVITVNLILLFHELLDFFLDLKLVGLESGFLLEVVACGLKLSFNDAEVVEDDILNLGGHAHLLDVLQVERPRVLQIVIRFNRCQPSILSLLLHHVVDNRVVFVRQAGDFQDELASEEKLLVSLRFSLQFGSVSVDLELVGEHALDDFEVFSVTCIGTLVFFLGLTLTGACLLASGLLCLVATKQHVKTCTCYACS